jgi:hypothetical protein
MKTLSVIMFVVLGIAGCANKQTVDRAGLEKFPQCYSLNPKISNKCIEKNKAGENVTAVQLENTAYPGQYQ